MNQHVIDTLISLVECTLKEREWLEWFDEHKELVEKTCGRIVFLKIKPKESFSDIRNTYLGQMAAFNWLKTKDINVALGAAYQKQYNQEFEDFCKQEERKDKAYQKMIKDTFEYLKDIYPVFFKQLQKSFDTSSRIEKGKSQSEIFQKEHILSVIFSPDLKVFFSNISMLRLEGIHINFDDIVLERFDNNHFLVLGEFWYFGDGDKLLYDLKTKDIVVLAHEHRPPKIIQIAKTMRDLLEKTFVTYLKEKS